MFCSAVLGAQILGIPRLHENFSLPGELVPDPPNNFMASLCLGQPCLSDFVSISLNAWLHGLQKLIGRYIGSLSPGKYLFSSTRHPNLGGTKIA